MNIALWTAAGLLALVFAAAGLMKLTRAPAELASKDGMGWVEDLPGSAVKTIGALETSAALGLALPALLDIAPVLTAWAATGLVLVMGGAAVVHLRRGEARFTAVNLVLLGLSAFVAWGRFGPYSF